MISVSSTKDFSSKKILSYKKAEHLIGQARKQGKRVGFCNGGFDLLHPGHVKHFESAKNLCDILVVSVTSDRFVSGRKGAGRPIFPETLRAYMIASLSCVDYVVVSDYKGIDVIRILKPTYYIKGPDFIHKETPGITAEREAIRRVGGEMRYTDDLKLSTTNIIDYIKTQIQNTTILFCIDRDGTLVENDHFFGRDSNWKKQLKINEPVVSLLSYIQTKFKTTSIVVTNQSGVARKYFSVHRVNEVHTALDNILSSRGIKIDDWQFCPDVDTTYAKKFPRGTFLPKFVKEKTQRKPSGEMVLASLSKQQKHVSDFDHCVVIGDRDDDKGLARELDAEFIHVKNKTYNELIEEFRRFGF